jgi:hypothetical protein
MFSVVGKTKPDVFVRLRDTIAGGDTCRLSMLLRGHRLQNDEDVQKNTRTN